MLTETPQEQKFIYYVCDESGHVLYEYNDEQDAMEVANKDESYSVSRKQLLTED